MSSVPPCTIVLHVAGDYDDVFSDSPTLAFGDFSPSSSSSSSSTLCDLDSGSGDLLTVPGAAEMERFRNSRITIDLHNALLNPQLARLRPAWTTAPGEDPDADRVTLVPNEFLELDGSFDDDRRQNRFRRSSKIPRRERKTKTKNKDKTKTKQKSKGRRDWDILGRIPFFGVVVVVLVLDGLVYLLKFLR